MTERNFMTYLEYRKYCALNGIRALKRKETGPIVTPPLVDLSREQEIDPVLEEIFFMLQEEGHLSRRLVMEFGEKTRVDLEPVMLIFDILGKEEITEEDFLNFMVSGGLNK